MPVIVHIPTALRKFTSGVPTLELTAASLPDLLDQLSVRYPDISRHLRDDHGELRRFVNIYVNDEDIRFLGGSNCKFADGDEILLVPSIAGGAPASNEAQVCVPATSANLGCAFDCAALAVNRYLRARATRRSEPGITFSYKGENAERISPDKPNLLIQAIQRFAESHGEKLPGLHVEVESEIPVGVGFGSSAAAIVAGLMLAARHLGKSVDTGEILSLAAKMEGHPDNVAAALLGGFTVAFLEQLSGRVLFAKAVVPADLRIIAIVPDVPLATQSARAVLPATYSREDVVHNLQRSVLLAAACFSGTFRLDPEMFRDRLHQPYRSRLIPGLEACLDVRHPSLLGVFLSGAGSSVLALVRDNEAEVAELLAQGFRSCGLTVQTLFLQAENRGVAELVREGAGKA
jgi:homoserine kinase